MSFAEKAKECEQIAKVCLPLKAYNSGANRAYYSAFLLARDYLDSKNFDCAAFLNMKKGKKNDRSNCSEDIRIRHGEICAMVKKCLEQQGKERCLPKLIEWHTLYNNRITADYRISSIKEPILLDSLGILNDIKECLHEDEHGRSQ